ASSNFSSWCTRSLRGSAAGVIPGWVGIGEDDMVVLGLVVDIVSQPSKLRSAIDERAPIQAGSVFKAGIYRNDSPPASLNTWLQPMAISSRVSRQSATKPGHTTSIFLHPCCASSRMVGSV